MWAVAVVVAAFHSIGGRVCSGIPVFHWGKLERSGWLVWQLQHCRTLPARSPKNSELRRGNLLSQENRQAFGQHLPVHSEAGRWAVRESPVPHTLANTWRGRSSQSGTFSLVCSGISWCFEPAFP